MAQATRTTVLTLGQHRGNPRIYIEGRWVIWAGFQPGARFRVTYAHQKIVITAAEDGRVVCGKRANTYGVIDLNGPEIAEAFHDAITRVTVHTDLGQIVITPSWLAMRQSQRVLVPTAVSIFAGGGLLGEALRQAGFEVVAAVEVSPAYADVYQLNHGSRLYQCSVEEVPWDELRDLAPIGLLEAGIPCEPFSRIRRLNRGGQEKRQRDLPPEAHELGDMVYWALKAADVLNPHTIVVEEVPTFLESGAGYILRLALARMGYQVDARVINPVDYGALTSRQRAVVVATSFDEVRWPVPKSRVRRLGEVLENLPDDSPLWFCPETKPWLYQHWERQSARGNGFAPPQLTAEDAVCPTIKKRYFAGQGDNAVIRHPSRPNCHRWLTVAEVRRIMGLPDTYDLGEALTTAGEVLGQGVQVEAFAQIIRSVTGRSQSRPKKGGAHVGCK